MKIWYQLLIFNVSEIGLANKIIQTAKLGFRHFWTKFSKNGYCERAHLKCIEFIALSKIYGPWQLKFMANSMTTKLVGTRRGKKGRIARSKNSIKGRGYRNKTSVLWTPSSTKGEYSFRFVKATRAHRLNQAYVAKNRCALGSFKILVKSRRDILVKLWRHILVESRRERRV